jgi:hypothetical protein
MTNILNYNPRLPSLTEYVSVTAWAISNWVFLVKVSASLILKKESGKLHRRALAKRRPDWLCEMGLTLYGIVKVLI